MTHLFHSISRKIKAKHGNSSRGITTGVTSIILGQNTSGPKKSAGRSRNLSPIRTILQSFISTLPVRKDFIEGELLSVTAYQVKNVCGTNQLLCVDPTRKNALYFGEADKGIFTTFDGGKSWRILGKDLPFGKDTASALNAIKADPKRPGWLYAGFIHEGLWRSKDYGHSWQKLFPSDNRVLNATAVTVGGPSGNEVYVASEPLYWSRSESAVYASFDNGKSWKDIYDKALGALRWKGIDVDNKTGNLYGVTDGNSAFYAERIR